MIVSTHNKLKLPLEIAKIEENYYCSEWLLMLLREMCPTEIPHPFFDERDAKYKCWFTLQKTSTYELSSKHGSPEMIELVLLSYF